MGRTPAPGGDLMARSPRVMRHRTREASRKCALEPRKKVLEVDEKAHEAHASEAECKATHAHRHDGVPKCCPAPLLPKGPPRLVGPTWWCPVKHDTTEWSLADCHSQNDGRLYVPIEAAENWCIEDAAPQYGYARALDEGFYAFVRRVRQPRPRQAWLLQVDGVEASIAAGPYVKGVPEAALIRAIQRNRDPEVLYFHACLEGGRLSITHFSGRQMDETRRKAGA